MLTSLGIRNYRNLKSLDIERLARVNLIAGKNNTGKTSLLEAVSLYAAEGDIQWIKQILVERGEVGLISYGRNDMPKKLNLDSYASMLPTRRTEFLGEDVVLVGELEKDIFGTTTNSERRVSIRFVKLTKESITSEYGSTMRTMVIEDASNSYNDVDDGLEVKFGSTRKFYSLERERLKSRSYYQANDTSRFNFQYVKTREIESNYNGSLWDNIALTQEESHVVKALRIIDSDVDRITFINDEFNRQRYSVIKMASQKEVVPLKSMGDGMNRILTIILALVNASDGYLLIDEFENGLHYTVQEDLWKMIFTLAQELNVQVFATTHSDDCIRAFENVLNSKGNQEQGLYFRLDNINGQIMPTFYSPSELNTATEQTIEMR